MVRDADSVVAVDAEERSDRASGAIVARSASAIEADWLIDLCADRIREERAYEWNAAAERVEVVGAWPTTGSCSTSGALASQLPMPTPRRWRARCPRRRGRAGRTRSSTRTRSSGCAARVAFVRAHLPEAGLPDVSEAELDGALARALRGRDSFAELREAGFVGALRGAARSRRRRRCSPERRPSG